jgi:hypothetical protein
VPFTEYDPAVRVTAVWPVVMALTSVLTVEMPLAGFPLSATLA